MHSGQQQQRQIEQGTRQATHAPPPSPRDAQRQLQRLDLLPEHPGGSDGGHSDLVQKWCGEKVAGKRQPQITTAR
jgi:hypothetical protein